uniref:Resistance to inhibitors of cholinesterase protein 3 N-terminal domain-containing protein n=2 Tax=Cacopsylla melanoneura TaxID=428564 RepID=A0A8D8LM56_9HEMI
MATSELSRGKTIFVLTVVAGCFAVLWPKIFYPMFFGSPQFQTNVEKAHGGPPQLNGCCDVYFEKDIQTLKIITQLCEENVLLNAIANSSRPLSKVAMLNLCYRQLQETCNIDLSNVFKMNQRHELDSSFKQFISIVRTFNSSLCLKYHYNVNFNVLGTPRIINSNVMKPTSLINAKKVDKDKNEKESMTDDGLKSQMRQERPPHMRPEMLHPALRENGRAIPHEHIVPRVEPDPVPRPVKQPGGPKPGMGRPAFGGGGPHAAKQGGGGIMNLLMPMYTISIVAFFIYTMLRFVSNSSNNARDGRNASSTDYYSSSTTELRSTSYYQEEYCASGNGAGKKQLPEPDAKPAAPAKEQEKPGSKLEDLEMESLRRRLEATEAAMERLVTQMLTTPPRLLVPLASVTMATVQDAPLAEDKSDSISSNVAKTSDSHTSGVTSKVDGGSEGEEELKPKTNGTVSTAGTSSTAAGPGKPSSLNLKESTKPMNDKKNYRDDIYETDVETESDEEEEEEEEVGDKEEEEEEEEEEDSEDIIDTTEAATTTTQKPATTTSTTAKPKTSTKKTTPKPKTTTTSNKPSTTPTPTTPKPTTEVPKTLQGKSKNDNLSPNSITSSTKASDVQETVRRAKQVTLDSEPFPSVDALSQQPPNEDTNEDEDEEDDDDDDDDDTDDSSYDSYENIVNPSSPPPPPPLFFNCYFMLLFLLIFFKFIFQIYD